MRLHPVSRLFSRCFLFLAIILGPAGAASAQSSADIVIHVADATDVGGAWQKITDSTAASGVRLWQPDAAVPKITPASATPQHYFDVQFHAESGRAYRLWIRAKADGNSYQNDSVYVQFSGSVNASGTPVYRIGTTSATTVIREDCSGCAFSGWGWQDNEYGNVALGPEIRFAQSGPQTVRIQAREDGISIDQIVLSSATWFTTPPGAKNNDTTIHPKTSMPATGTLAFTAQPFTTAYFDGVTAADLNGDAKRDLAGVYTGGLELYSVINDGGRAFHSGFAQDQWESLSYPPRVFGGDFNRDGKPDLLLLDEFRNLVAVFPGDGAGAFAAPVVTSFSERVNDLTVADFTSDGILDIAVAEPDLGNAALHAGDGAGRFSFVSFVAVGPAPGEIVAGDFDGDRRQDLAVACSDRLTFVYGDGTGRFGRLAALVTLQPIALAAADLDGDGYTDVVSGLRSHRAHILYGSASTREGVFVNTSRVAGAEIVRRGIASGDMTGDGRTDLVVTHSDGSNQGGPSFSVVPSSGAGAFGTPVDFAKASALPALVADLDGDTRPDVVSPDANNGFTIYWNDPAQGNRAPVANAGEDIYVIDSNQKGVELYGGNSTDPDGHALSYVWTEPSSGGRWTGRTVQPFQNGWAPGTYTFTLTVDDFQGGTSSDTVTVTIDRPAPPPTENRPPVAQAGVSMGGIWPYEAQFQDMPDVNTYMWSDSTDPDGDPLTHEWKNAAGEIISTNAGWDTYSSPALPPGTHTFTLTVRDGRGGESSTTVTVTVKNFEEIVINGAGYKEYLQGTEWEEWEEPGPGTWTTLMVRDLDAAAPKLNVPFASPGNYVDYGFVADPTLEYKLWIRLKAQNDYWGNDSIWVQFSGATDAAGNPVFREGTTSGLAINLEECNGCGLAGWGWRDEAWGAPGVVSSTYLRFPAGGVQGIRIQTREDGVMVSQIVLSARKHKTTRPGTVKNDTTVLPMTAFWGT